MSSARNARAWQAAIAAWRTRGGHLLRAPGRPSCGSAVDPGGITEPRHDPGGVAPCLLALGIVTRWPGMLLLSGLFGLGLMAWIGAQWALLQDRLWLQPAMLISGAVIAALAGRALMASERR